ncbi:hypothetical protein FPY71_15750 [Aureimonas fodinaquatilis]|uniref:Polysaccharide deacetylase n=1 Tax=Aureimonas fodinaquatilis TaxID=2565783 RepID=A0A5B0DSN9_9HYPH|nr:polysaccharide deacetylase family protein [Aureimonas fodinaquatilis]KAA0969005.1 hypothetical protein FPY71_15750 [Aureimonas fodinaquatilis]
MDDFFSQIDALLALRPKAEPLKVWWRDDDATEPTAALDRLLEISANHRAPLALAVVPQPVQARLLHVLSARQATVLQHGFAHTNHAAAGGRAVECGGSRPAQTVMDELRLGSTLLQSLFGSLYLPVMVPPWNRIEAEIAGQLSKAGYIGLSCFGPEPEKGLPGLGIHNAHIDILRWKGGAHFAGMERMQRDFAEELALRQQHLDKSLCILSHHLAHDHESWEFLDRLVQFFASHPAVAFQSAQQIFRQGAPQ